MKQLKQAGKAPSRRSFLRRGVLGVGLYSLGSAAGWFTNRVPAQTIKPATGGRQLGKEFSYDLGSLSRTDPKLILYTEARRFPTGLKELRALAIGPRDQVVVAGDRTLASFDQSGVRSSSIPLDEPPRCLAIAADGAVFVGLKDHLLIYGSDGKRQAEWERLGPKAVLTSIASGAKDVFVADAGNRIILRYDRSGKLKSRIGKKDAARHIPGFVVPSPYFDLAIGPGDLVWVANTGNHHLEAYTYDGDLETSWGEAANAIKGFCGCCNPAHFALLPDGRFVTSEKGLTRVKVYSPKGEFEGVVAGPECFPKLLDSPAANATGLDVAADAQGRVFVADTSTSEIRVFEPRKPA